MSHFDPHQVSSSDDDLEGSGGTHARVRRKSRLHKLSSKDLTGFSIWSVFHARQREICGEDKRFRVADTTEVPWRCICRLIVTARNGKVGTATGFFIGPRCVITNGHVVFPNDDWAKEIKVIPGLDGNVDPFGLDVSEKFKSTEGWTKNTDSNFDYGAIILSSDHLYRKIGYVLPYEEHDMAGELTISGYPDNSQYPPGSQVFGTDNNSSITDFGYRYVIDTSDGQSGSPILRNVGHEFVCVGVHSVGQCPNLGIRCTPAVIENWDGWRNL